MVPHHTISDFYCTKCGNRMIPVWRSKGKEREPGHLKKLYCLNCKEERNGVEIKFMGQYTLKDFIMEYEYNNFDKDGNRKHSYKELKGLINNGKIKKSKTYNDGRSSGIGENILAEQSQEGD